MVLVYCVDDCPCSQSSQGRFGAKSTPINLNCAQVGAEELDPESYKSASDMRARLHEAAKVRVALDTAVKALQRQLRSEDAAAVEKALQVRYPLYPTP